MDPAFFLTNPSQTSGLIESVENKTESEVTDMFKKTERKRNVLPRAKTLKNTRAMKNAVAGSYSHIAPTPTAPPTPATPQHN